MNVKRLAIHVLCLTISAFAAQQSAASGGPDIGYHLHIDETGWSERSEVLATFFHGATVESLRPFLGSEELLQQAARYIHDADLVSFLIASGFDPNTAFGFGMEEYQDWGPLLREGPLHWAAEYNPEPSVVLALLKGGADVHAKAGFRLETPLHRAAKHNNVAVVRALIEGGADPNAINGEISVHRGSTIVNGNTPLHNAACNKDASVVNAVIDAGADVERRNACGFLPLHFAIVCKQAESIAVLRRFGTDLGALVEEGDGSHNCTGCNVVHLLLHSLIASVGGLEPTEIDGAMEFLQTLVDDGASVNAEIVEPGMYAGYSPLRLAIEGDLGPAVVARLIELGANAESELLHALLAGRFQYSSSYAGANRARDVGSPGNLEILDHLLDQEEMDVNTKGPCGLTPLHAAVTFAYLRGDGVGKMIARLIAAGTDVNTSLSAGADAIDEWCLHTAFTPLQEAVRFVEGGEYRYAIASMLLAAGADPNVPNMAGKNAFDIAANDRMKALLAGQRQVDHGRRQE